MNEIKIIKKSFDFLLNRGFVSTYTKNNLEYCVIYSSSKARIFLDYDLRTHRFEVDICIISKNNSNGSYMSILDMNIGNEYNKKETMQRINSVYKDAQKDWILSKEHFRSIVEIYAQFLKQNIDLIESLC